MREGLLYDIGVFENMKKKALDLLQNPEKEEYTQVIVLYTVSGKEYSRVIQNALSREKTDESALLEQLKEANETEVRYVLCIWQDGSLDITSYAFRNMLLCLDSQNSESLMFVRTADGISVKKLSSTMN